MEAMGESEEEMSFVSGVILIHFCGEQGETDDSLPYCIEAVNRWLKDVDDRNFSPLADVTDHASGSKHPQCQIYCAGYNYFPEDEFAKFVVGLPWEYPENVVLVIQPEEGETRVWRGSLGSNEAATP